MAANSDYLKWLVDRRSKSQEACYELLCILSDKDNKIRLRKKREAQAAQSLVGAAFSLWRAVFLADKDSEPGIPLSHAVKFLEKIVRTNTIAFSHEMESNEWTFNYYLFNARCRLLDLHSEWPVLMKKWTGKRSKATDRWDYLQSKFEEAVHNFGKDLKKSRSIPS